MGLAEPEKSSPVTGGRRPRRLLVIAAAVLAVLGIALVIGVAASDDGETPPAGIDPVATDPAELIATWRPTFIQGVTVLDSTRPKAATITFGKDGKWHGSDGCNGIGGSYDADPGKLSVDSGPSTAIGCDNVPNAEALTNSAHFRVADAVLTLYDDNWNRVATYSRV